MRKKLNEVSAVARNDGKRSVPGWAALMLIAAIVLPVRAHTEASQVEGVWTTRAHLPDRRSEVSVTSDGERLYVLGGFAEGPDGATAPRAVYVYSPSADVWTELTRVPEGVNHAGLAYLRGKLYVIGGFRETSFDATDALHIYDIANRTWREGPPLPTPRGALAVAVQDGRIHAIGGLTADKTDTGAHEIFDPIEDKWTTAADLPTPRNHIAAVAVDSSIFVLAGRDAETFTLAVNEVYDVSTDTWRKAPDVPTGRSGVAAVEVGGLVYLFGGEDFTPPTTFDTVERFDPRTETWVALPQMPIARHGLGAGVVGNRIHVVAGGPQAGLSFSDDHEVLMPGR